MKLMAWLKANKKLALSISLTVVLLLAIITSCLIWYFGTRPAAIIGDKEVSQIEFSHSKSICEATAKFEQNSYAKANCGTTSLDDLVYHASLEQDAKRFGITVTEEEINAWVDVLAASYSSKEAFYRTMKDAYGADEKDVANGAEKTLLKNKLESKLISGSSVWGPFMRWDYTDSLNETDLADAKKATSDLYDKYFSDVLVSGVTQETAEATLKTMQANEENWSSENMAGIISSGLLNSANESNEFAGREDWNAISKLDKAGDISPVVVSAGGYVVRYVLTEKSEGDYSSWDDYFAKAKANAKYLSLEYRIQKMGTQMASISSELLRSLGVTKVYAKITLPMNCSNQHFSQFTGTFENPLGNKISGVLVAAAHGSIGTFPACVKPQESGSTSVSSGDNGYFKIGDVQDADQKKLSCWVRWNVTLTKADYQTVKYNERTVIHNGKSVTLDHKVTEKSGFSYDGPSGSKNENLDGDGLIILSPIETIHPSSSSLKVVVEPQGAAVMLGNGTFDTTNTSQIYKATFSGVDATKYKSEPIWSTNIPGMSCPEGRFEKGANLSLVCTAQFALISEPTPTPGCKITATPTSGLSPMVVKVTTSSDSGLTTFDYNMGDLKDTNGVPIGTMLNGRGSVIYYTYSKPGIYRILVKNGSTTCSAKTVGSDTVNVTSGESGSQGEVSP